MAIPLVEESEIKGNEVYDSEELLEYLKLSYKDLGRVPGERDFNNSKYPKFWAYIKVFGSWNNAIKEAGLLEKRNDKERKIKVSTDGKNYFWIIAEYRRITNINPTEEDLHIVSKVVSYSKTNICPICIEEKEKDGKELTDKSVLYPGNSALDIDEDGKKTNEYVCKRHYDIDYQRHDPNSSHNTIKSMRNVRTGNQDPNDESTKGSMVLDTVCELFGLVDLNKKYDKYDTPIDCIDEKTGELYQVQGRRYDSINTRWGFGGFKKDWKKEYKSVVCVCLNIDGTIIEELYIIPFGTIYNSDTGKGITGVTIVKYDSHGRLYYGCYEQYRIKGKQYDKYLNNANEILNRKLKEYDIKKC